MIAPEHEHMSNQELIDIYGPQVTNWKKPKKKTEVVFVEPAHHRAIYDAKINKEGHLDKRIEIPDDMRDLVYRLPSKKARKKMNKGLAKQKREAKIKFKVKAISSPKRLIKQRLKNVRKMRSLQSGN